MLMNFLIYVKTFGKIVACDTLEDRPHHKWVCNQAGGGGEADKIHSVLAVSWHIQQSPKTRGELWLEVTSVQAQMERSVFACGWQRIA